MKAYAILIALFILLTACAFAAATPDGGAQDVAIYIKSTDLLVAESYPVQISLHVTGDLPTPCHSFNYSYQIGSPNDRFRIDVSAWSESDPDAVCVQVLEPFDVNIAIPMEGAPQGSYSVWLNGEKIGDFSYPA